MPKTSVAPYPAPYPCMVHSIEVSREHRRIRFDLVFLISNPLFLVPPGPLRKIFYSGRGACGSKGRVRKAVEGAGTFALWTPV